MSKPADHAENPLLPTATLHKLHALMGKCHAEAEAAALGLGREAIAALIMQLSRRDAIVCSHLDVPVLAARGLTQTAEAQNAITDLPPATRVKFAAGMACAAQLHGLHEVTVAFTTVRALKLASTQLALRMASERRLPLVIAVETRADGDLRSLKGLRMTTITVDAADAVAIFRVTQEALERARRDVGPTLIECRVIAGEEPLAQLAAFIDRKKQR